MSIATLNWPSFSAFLIVWICISFGTWGIVCLLALTLMGRLLHSGLVPPVILLILAFVPISAVTLVVQSILFLVGVSIWRLKPQTSKRLVLFGTPAVTWICLLVLTWLAGGPDAFVPRL